MGTSFNCLFYADNLKILCWSNVHGHKFLLHKFWFTSCVVPLFTDIKFNLCMAIDFQISWWYVFLTFPTIPFNRLHLPYILSGGLTLRAKVHLKSKIFFFTGLCLILCGSGFPILCICLNHQKWRQVFLILFLVRTGMCRWLLVCSFFHIFCRFNWTFSSWSFSSWFLGSCSSLFFSRFLFFTEAIMSFKCFCFCS